MEHKVFGAFRVYGANMEAYRLCEVMLDGWDC